MKIYSFLNKKSIEKGIKLKHDSKNKFNIKRHLDRAGLYYYTLENQALREQIVIQRHLFERFRIEIFNLQFKIDKTNTDPLYIDQGVISAVQYKDEDKFIIQNDKQWFFDNTLFNTNGRFKWFVSF